MTTGYDPAGRKTTETDALGRVHQLGYDKAGRLLTRTLLGYHNADGTTRNVVVERTAYDAAGNVTDRKAGNDQSHLHIEVDYAGRVTKQILDPPTTGLKRTTVYTLDGNGNVTVEVRTEGARREEIRSEYDDASRLISRTVENGATDLTTTYGYDLRGLMTSETEPRGNAAGATAAAYTTRYAYDVVGRRVSTTAPETLSESGGNSPSIVPAVDAIGYDTFGSATNQKDARGSLTHTVYDRLGQAVSTQLPAYTPPGGAPLSPTEHTTYDRVGNIISKTDRRGKVTTHVYDNLNRLTATYDPPATSGAQRGITRIRYDVVGNATSRTDQTGAVKEWTYDDRNRVRTTTDVVRPPSLTGPPSRFVTHSDYDDMSNLTYTRTPVGDVSTTVYNPAGEPKTHTDEAGKVWTQSYLLGLPTSSIDPIGRKTETEFDPAGRRIALRRYDSAGTLRSTEAFGFDAAGNQISTTSARGFTTTQSFDARNRVTAAVQPVDATLSISRSYGYDVTGNLTRVTDGRGYATVASYTPWNQREDLVEPSTTSHPEPGNWTFTSIYDAAGLEKERREPGGIRVVRQYDGLGRVTSETGSGPGVASATRTFGYDLAGRRTSFAHPNGTVESTYDDRGLNTGSGGPAGTASFTYDAAGRLTARTDPAGAHTFAWTPRSQLLNATDPLSGATRTHTYDDAGQLTQITFAAGTQTSRRVLAWDYAGRLASDELKTAANATTAAHAYTYYPDGNPETLNVTLPGNSASGAYSYAYDRAGRLTQFARSGGPSVSYTYDLANNRTGAGSQVFTYDERGRLTSSPDGTHSWTARGTRSETVASNGTRTTYAFDGLGRQVTAAGVSFTYDSLDRLTARGPDLSTYAGQSSEPSSIGTRKYGRDPFGQVLSVFDGTTALLSLPNRHGDLVGRHTAAGSLSAATVFDPFGSELAQTGSGDTFLGFQSDVTHPAGGETLSDGGWLDSSNATLARRLDSSSESSALAGAYAYASGAISATTADIYNLAPAALPRNGVSLPELTQSDGSGNCASCSNLVAADAVTTQSSLDGVGGTKLARPTLVRKPQAPAIIASAPVDEVQEAESAPASAPQSEQPAWCPQWLCETPVYHYGPLPRQTFVRPDGLVVYVDDGTPVDHPANIASPGFVGCSVCESYGSGDAGASDGDGAFQLGNRALVGPDGGSSSISCPGGMDRWLCVRYRSASYRDNAAYFIYMDFSADELAQIALYVRYGSLPSFGLDWSPSKPICSGPGHILNAYYDWKLTNSCIRHDFGYANAFRIFDRKSLDDKEIVDQNLQRDIATACLANFHLSRLSQCIAHSAQVYGAVKVGGRGSYGSGHPWEKKKPRLLPTPAYCSQGGHVEFAGRCN